MKYQTMMGGRFYPGVSREELSEAVQGMEILIARMNTTPRHYSYMSLDFFQTMFTENLADKCKIVIARIVDDKDSSKTSTSRRGRRSTTKPKDLIKMNGLDTEQYKGKLFIITDGSKTKSKGKKSKASTQTSIDEVRSELTGQEVKMAITQPVKETVTAGKAVVGLGARLGKWFSSLIKSQ